MPFGAEQRVLARAEQAAENIRRDLSIEGPVSAFVVADRLNMKVFLNRRLPRRGLTCPGKPSIFLRSGELGTRMEHACAHEIGHHHVWDTNAAADLLERACNRFAAALLLPAAEFRASVRELGDEPRALARVWRFSSLEAICRRIGEVVPGSTAAGWLEYRRKWRSSDGEPSAALARLETEALGDAYLRPRGVGVAEGVDGLVRVWRTGTSPRSAVSLLRAA